MKKEAFLSVAEFPESKLSKPDSESETKSLQFSSRVRDRVKDTFEIWGRFWDLDESRTERLVVSSLGLPFKPQKVNILAQVF